MGVMNSREADKDLTTGGCKEGHYINESVKYRDFQDSQNEEVFGQKKKHCKRSKLLSNWCACSYAFVQGHLSVCEYSTPFRLDIVNKE